jgi:hypothetical protein
MKTWLHRALVGSMTKSIRLVLISSLLAGCAEGVRATTAPSGEQDPTVDAPGSEGPGPRWDNILVGGLDVATVAEASSAVRFQPVRPSDIGAPERIVVSPSDDGSLASVMAMRFTTEEYGMFWLIQEESQTTQEELEGLASACDPSNGCEGNWTLIVLADGTTALAIDGPASTSLMWLEGGVRLDLTGPPTTFTVAQAQAIADSLTTSA